MVFADFSAGDISGSLGIIGPSRLDYPSVIAVVRFFRKLLKEISKNW